MNGIELNSTNFAMLSIFNLSVLSAIIGVPIFSISSHFRFSKKSVNSDSIVSTCDNCIDSTCEFKLASIEM